MRARLAIAVGALLVLGLVPPVGAETFTIKDPNDVEGRLDLHNSHLNITTNAKKIKFSTYDNFKDGDVNGGNYLYVGLLAMRESGTDWGVYTFIKSGNWYAGAVPFDENGFPNYDKEKKQRARRIDRNTVQTNIDKSDLDGLGRHYDIFLGAYHNGVYDMTDVKSICNCPFE